MRWTASAFVLRLLLFVIDHKCRFFLGDSGSYLATEFGGWIPPDRSWTYGIAINAILRVTHHVWTLELAQVIATSVLCASVPVFCRSVGVRTSLCWAALILLSLDPLSIWSERSIMSDIPAAAAAWVGTLLAICSLRERGGVWSVGSALSLAIAITLRTAVLPIAGAITALTFVARIWGSRSSTSRAREAASALVLPAILVLFLFGYARITGYLAGYPPSINPAAGNMILGTVAPLVEPEDFAGLGVADPVALLSNPSRKKRSERNCQVFCPDGIDLRLLAQLHDLPAATQVAGTAARRSILRNPRGFLQLYADNLVDYLTPSSYKQVFDTTFGLDRPLSDAFIGALKNKASDAITANSPALPSVALDWARAMWFWPVALAWLALGLPLLSFVILPILGKDAQWPAALLAATTLGYISSVFIFSLEVIPRFLLPIAPFVAALLALLGEQVFRSLPTLWRLRDKQSSR